MSERETPIKDQIDQILIELSREIDAAICIGPLSECKDRLDRAIAKARLRIMELYE